jgi:hypothetical protein
VGVEVLVAVVDAVAVLVVVEVIVGEEEEGAGEVGVTLEVVEDGGAVV